MSYPRGKMKIFIVFFIVVLAGLAHAEGPDFCDSETTELLEKLNVTKVRWDLNLRINANDAQHDPGIDCGSSYNHPVISIDLKSPKRERVYYTIANVDKNGLPYFYRGDTSEYNSGRIFIPKVAAEALYDGETLLLEVWADPAKNSFQRSVRVLISTAK